MRVMKRKRLLITSGDGPKECQRAVVLCLRQMEKEAKLANFPIEIDVLSDEQMGCVQSAMVSFTSSDEHDFLKRWCGSIQWICNSPFRPRHKRQNWFVAVFELPDEKDGGARIDSADLQFETFRAGGPGGQHQNKTDSAVRLTHIPTGLSVVAKDERSQHRNRQIALDRLKAKFILNERENEACSKRQENLFHKQLERGNPVLVFEGEKFVERRR